MDSEGGYNEELPQITLITASVFLKWLTEGIDEIYAGLGKIFDFKIYFLHDLDSGKVSEKEMVETLYKTKVLLIDIRGNSPTVELLVKTFMKMETENPELYAEKEIIALVGGNSEIRRLTKLGTFQARKIPAPSSTEYGMDEIPDMTNAVRFGQRMTSFLKILGNIFPVKTLKHARNWVTLMDYWVYGLGGIAKNHKHMILFLLRNYLGHKSIKVDKPAKIPPYGIYDPKLNEYFQTTTEYFEKKGFKSTIQTIGIFYYGGLYFEQSLPIVEHFIQNLPEFNIIPVFSDVLTNVEAYNAFFFRDGIASVSAVINLQYFQLNGGPFGGDGSVTYDLFKKMDVPQFNPIIQYDLTYEDYIKSNEGIYPINQVIAIVMPELDGRIEMTTVGVLNNLGYSSQIKSDVLEVIPLTENIEGYCKRIQHWLKLRNKNNHEKKIGIIIYNYPPGEDKIGNAAYLDVSESIKNLMGRLTKEGYKTEPIGENESLMDMFVASGIVNTPKFTSIKNYKGMTLDVKMYREMFDRLPAAHQQEMIEFWGEPPGDIMVQNSHIKIPIIRLGNIFLCLQPSRSKVSGDSNEYHNKNLPPHHQYHAFYHYLKEILDLDAIIHLGTHGTEEFLPGKECAGWVGDYNIELINSLPNIYYYHITNTSESAIAKRRGNAVIINHAGPAFQNSELYDEFDRLETLIAEYQNKTLLFDSQELNQKSSERIEDLEREIKELALDMKLEYKTISELEDKLYRYKTSIIPMGLHTLGLDYTSQQLKDLIQNIILNSTEKPEYIEDLLECFQMNGSFDNEKFNQYLDACFKLFLPDVPKSKVAETLANQYDAPEQLNELTVTWIQDLFDRLSNSLELNNIIRALEGRYIEPGLGGDPIRSPHIFPTGKNSYGFDPRLIPNSTALKRGGQIAEKLLIDYKEDHGEWPETVSVVLWAFETMKTGGETIGQIFNYLGVRPVKNKSIWTTELEIIPLEEMTHPRINVIITICGIFRDTFPYHLDLLNNAIELVANQKETVNHNFVKKSMDIMKQKGLENINARVFGPPPGKYNTNLTEIVSAGKWDKESELSKDYLENMSFAYLKNQKVKQELENFTHNISNIEIMSQIRDSSEYSITDLDHYYEFTGGLARTFKEISGKDANVFIADSSRKDIDVKSLKESVSEGAITRSLNPKWINSLLQHKYHGGQKVAERVENFLGLAATSDSVDNWIWDKAYAQYIENEEIRTALENNNRFAMMDLIKNMVQANNRGYWDTDEGKIDNLKRIYLELENWIELTY